MGLDGSLYIADPALHRVRKIDPSGNISTVVGSGAACSDPLRARVATVARPARRSSAARTACGSIRVIGLYIADGPAGLRLVSGGIAVGAHGTAAYDVRSVAGDANGRLYAAAHAPAYIWSRSI